MVEHIFPINYISLVGVLCIYAYGPVAVAVTVAINMVLLSYYNLRFAASHKNFTCVYVCCVAAVFPMHGSFHAQSILERRKKNGADIEVNDFA